MLRSNDKSSAQCMYLLSSFFIRSVIRHDPTAREVPVCVCCLALSPSYTQLSVCHCSYGPVVKWPCNVPLSGIFCWSFLEAVK